MRTYEISFIGKEYIIQVLFNDGYTCPMRIGGYFHTLKKADDYLSKHLENLKLI